MENRINEAQQLKMLKHDSELSKILEIHLNDNRGEFLSTLFFADLSRLYLELFNRNTDEEKRRKYLQLVEKLISNGNEYVRDGVILGFVEGIAFEKEIKEIVAKDIKSKYHTLLAQLQVMNTDLASKSN